MANRVKVTGLKEFQKEYERTLEQLLNRTYMLRLATLARKLIYSRTKSGFGVNDDKADKPTKTRLVPLKPSYVKVRSRLAQAGKLGRFAELGTSPGRSNLTLSGQMLESIIITDYANRKFSLEIPATMRDDEKTNQQIAEYVSANGRSFFALTESEQRILFKEIERDTRLAFRRLNQK